MKTRKNNNTSVNDQRRDLIKTALQMGAVSVGAGLLDACGASAATTASNTAPSSAPAEQASVKSLYATPSLPTGNFRIDVHCHHIPDFYRTSLADNGIVTAGGIPLPPWSPSLAVEFMNNYGIQVQVVSISEPGVYYLPTAAARQSMAMQINDYTTSTLLNSSDPTLAGRFGGFAVLPLGNPQDPQDMLNASAEATRALTTLRMDGIGLYSNYHGIYLGDPSLEPLMATLNALGAMVFVHPVTPSAYPNLNLPTFLYEFPFDTTRAVINMLYHGIFQRYPNIRWLLAHAGGTVPFIAYRASLLTLYPAIAQNLGLSGLDNQNAAFASLFYDTALSPAPSAMQSVRQVTNVSHIMFATDWPFSAPLFVVPGDPAPQLSSTFNSTELSMVDRGNALAQLPTLKARIGA